jgi:ABC-type transport system substrate-binding protein
MTPELPVIEQNAADEASAQLHARIPISWEVLPTVNSFNYQGVRLGQYAAGNLNPASAAQGGLGSQFSGFQNDGYTQLTNQLVTATDAAIQRQLYARLTDHYIDQTWALPIVPNPEHVAATTNVHGLRYDPRPGLVTAEIWLS